MWYTRIIESGSAWDVLSTKEVAWSGSFSRTFKDFSFYDANLMPTMTAMLKLIADIEKGKGNEYCCGIGYEFYPLFSKIIINNIRSNKYNRPI